VVCTGAGAVVADGVGFADGAVVLPPLLPELVLELVVSFAAGFFFLGSDFNAGSAAEALTPLVTFTAASSTGFVPSAELALVVSPLLEPPPPPAPLAKKATAKATTTTPSVIPI
jgi:hypothetical protein